MAQLCIKYRILNRKKPEYSVFKRGMFVLQDDLVSFSTFHIHSPKMRVEFSSSVMRVMLYPL